MPRRAAKLIPHSLEVLLNCVSYAEMEKLHYGNIVGKSYATLFLRQGKI
jgi:hypothetical protein